MRAADLLAFEEVEIVNLATAERWRTYVEPAGSGEVRLHTGARNAARVGDLVQVLSWGLLHDGQTLAHRVKIVALDDQNRIVSLTES